MSDNRGAPNWSLPTGLFRTGQHLANAGEHFVWNAVRVPSANSTQCAAPLRELLRNAGIRTPLPLSFLGRGQMDRVHGGALRRHLICAGPFIGLLLPAQSEWVEIPPLVGSRLLVRGFAPMVGYSITCLMRAASIVSFVKDIDRRTGRLLGERLVLELPPPPPPPRATLFPRVWPIDRRFHTTVDFARHGGSTTRRCTWQHLGRVACAKGAPHRTRATMGPL